MSTQPFVVVIGKETNKPIYPGLLRSRANLIDARILRGEFRCLGRKAGLDHFAQQLHRSQYLVVRDQTAAVELGENATQADFVL